MSKVRFGTMVAGKASTHYGEVFYGFVQHDWGFALDCNIGFVPNKVWRRLSGGR